MGGANGGSTASRVAAEAISETLKSGYRTEMTPDDIRSLMKISVEYANKSVYEMSIHVPGLSGMGTTVVCAVVRGGNAFVLHAGDSRAYLFSNGMVRQITTDHSVVQEMVDAGEITPEEARGHYMKNIITRALGTEPSLKTDFTSVPLSEGERLVICTDGMSNYITDHALQNFIEKYDCSELAGRLIEESNRLGGSDNITVAVIAP